MNLRNCLPLAVSILGFALPGYGSITFLTMFPTAGLAVGQSAITDRKLSSTEKAHKRPPGPDRWKLARVADQDEPVHALERLDERGEHFLCEHRRLVDDDRVCAGLDRLL